MNLLIFQNPYELFQFFLTFMEMKKNLSYNCATVSSTTWEILVRDMKSCYKTYPKLVTLHSLFKISIKTYVEQN